MKKLLILLCLLLSGCAATYDGPTETKEVLTEYYTVHQSTFTDSTWTTRSVYAYDIYGNVASVREYDDGELAQVSYYRYDDRGNRISEVRWSYAGWIPYPERRTEKTYDDQNRVLTRIDKNGWGIKEGSSAWVYDDEAHTTTYTTDTGLTVTYYYDEDGKDLRSTDSSGYESFYHYDESGFLIKTESFKDGVSMGWTEYENDEQGRRIRWTVYDETCSRYSELICVFDDEAHTMTQLQADGDKRIVYYTPDGRQYLIEDYDAEGNLGLYQQYHYQEIRVPIDREE